jgi:hypothetical protein
MGANPVSSLFSLDEMFKAATESASCVKETPFQSNAEHSPFAMRHQLPLYQFYQSNPEHAKRFAKAMAGWTQCIDIPPTLTFKY